jgi:GT2 family glycosyltransferase
MANSYVVIDDPVDLVSEEIRLNWINRVYAKFDLSPLIKFDASRPLAIDNLSGSPQERKCPKDQVKVSVIIPAYKARDTLPTALRGLVEQTWRNLELIVVDDCSPDETFDVAEYLARQDDRIIAIRQKHNEGAYRARNKGLEVATGALITVHDADDWSHPQKIEMQVARLLHDPDSLANYSSWVRTSSHLYFSGPFRPSSKWVIQNHSSLMFRRDVVDQQGGWDNVRVSADTEFLRRLVQRGGDKCVESVYQDVPLAFAGNDKSSLTRQNVTHVKTIYHGLRREYHAAAQYWHSCTNSADLRIDTSLAARPFPAPSAMLPNQTGQDHYDLLVITDFNLSGGSFHSTMNYIRAAMNHGMSVAAFHWPRYDLGVARPLNAEVRGMAHAGKVRVVAPGDRVCATNVIVGYPVILRHALDSCPHVEFENFIVVVNQMATRLYDGGDVQYDPLIVRENLRQQFGTEGTWAPISRLVRRLMDEDERYPRPHSDTWFPLIDTDLWCKTSLRWRGHERERPKVGRHGRDHYTKWPSTPEAVRSAYCANQACTVELLGGAKRALEILGVKPRNWVIHEFGSIEPYAFLSDIDFFVHFPHENYIEEFGRAALEAMAVGIPVILPTVFRETFGDAALYSEQRDVWTTLEALWADERAYLAQAEAGRSFVLTNCRLSNLAPRLACVGRTLSSRIENPESTRPRHHVSEQA